MKKTLFKDSKIESIHKFYDLGSQIGVGKFSIVKNAVEKSTSKPWAVKLMKKSVVQENDILKEIEIMNDVKHQNIISLNEVYETDSEILMVLELVTGGELFDKIVERVSYTEEDASKLVNTLTKVIQFLHSKDIVHCDLKPENLLYSDSSDQAEIKLCDFGLSQRCPKGTELRSLVGTLSYMAPEISTCNGYGKPVDLWSLGVIIYILLCGFPPFDESTGYYLEFPSPEWDNISDSAKNLIKALLVIDPTKRLTAAQTLAHPWVSGANVGKESIMGTLHTLREFNTLRRSGTLGAMKQSRSSVFELFPSLNGSPSSPAAADKRNSYNSITSGPIRPSPSLNSIPKIIDTESVNKINNELKLSGSFSSGSGGSGTSSMKNSNENVDIKCNSNNNELNSSTSFLKKQLLIESLEASSATRTSAETMSSSISNERLDLQISDTIDLGGASSDSYYQHKITNLNQEKAQLLKEIEDLKKENQLLRANSSSPSTPVLSSSYDSKLKYMTHLRTDSGGSSFSSDSESSPMKKDKSKYGVDRIVSDLIGEVDKLFLSKESTEKINTVLTTYRSKNQEKSLKHQYEKQKEKYKKLKAQMKNHSKVQSK